MCSVAVRRDREAQRNAAAADDGRRGVCETSELSLDAWAHRAGEDELLLHLRLVKVDWRLNYARQAPTGS